MNSDHENQPDTSSELMMFIRRYFDRHGAAVEESGCGLDILVPGPLMGRLSVQELIRVEGGSGPVPRAEPRTPAEPAYPVAFGSEFLERVLRHACGDVPVVCCQLDFSYLKSQGFEALARECFQLKGALLRVDQWAKVITVYVVLTCTYLAQSDEQKEGLFEFGVHLETGAFLPAFGAGLEAALRSFTPGPAEPNRLQDQLRKIFPGLKRSIEETVRRETAAFLESTNRKFRRDVLNLEEYYQSLEGEMRQSLDRTGLSDQLVRARMDKIALIPEELARKKDDLRKKYSVRISTAPCAALLVSTPAIKVLLNVSIGRKKRSLSAYYNPVTRTMDPLVCEGCGGSSTVFSFCDQGHLLCRGCTGACPACRPLPPGISLG